MDKREMPIAVFDSGAGGISVLREMVRLMPNENYIYLGDSLNAPYGTRPTEEVRQLTVKNISALVDRGIKEAVVACNTATSAAVRVLREMYPQIPMVGLEPAIKPASLYAKGGSVLVMATQLTLREKKLHSLIEKYKGNAQIILLPCPGLVELAERGITQGEELTAYLNHLLSPYLNKVDAIVLGCTHFPLVKNAIQAVVGDVKLFDGGEGAAREARRRLDSLGLLNPSATKGSIAFESTLEGKAALYERLFNM